MSVVYLKKLDEDNPKIAIRGGLLQPVKWVPLDRSQTLTADQLIAFAYDRDNSEACIKGIVEWCRFQKQPFPSGEYGLCTGDLEGNNMTFGRSFFTFWLKRPTLKLKQRYSSVWR